jgi:hypothetical protein
MVFVSVTGEKWYTNALIASNAISVSSHSSLVSSSRPGTSLHASSTPPSMRTIFVRWPPPSDT